MVKITYYIFGLNTFGCNDPTKKLHSINISKRWVVQMYLKRAGGLKFSLLPQIMYVFILLAAEKRIP